MGLSPSQSVVPPPSLSRLTPTNRPRLHGYCRGTGVCETSGVSPSNLRPRRVSFSALFGKKGGPGPDIRRDAASADTDLLQYMIRRGYYAANQTSHMAFDLGLDRESHVGHCFDYLRQSLVCSADSNLQPANRRVFEDADWGFDRQCRDIEELRTWAEEWRVWDMNGTFIPSTFIQEDK